MTNLGLQQKHIWSILDDSLYVYRIEFYSRFYSKTRILD